jgi:hypothetical protein
VRSKASSVIWPTYSRHVELGDNASYLTEPPDSAQAMPPVSSTSLQLLPLASLTPPNLERLCLRLGEKEGEVEYAGIYGVPGQAQDGIDVLVRASNNKYRLIQSRRTKEVTALRDAVTDFLDGKWATKASSFVYATSASAARTEVQDEIVTQSERLAAKGVEFDVWDDDGFSRMLKGHPDLVVDFFGVEVLRVFLPDQAGPALAQELVQQLSPQLEAAVTSALQGAEARRCPSRWACRRCGRSRDSRTAARQIRWPSTGRRAGRGRRRCRRCRGRAADVRAGPSVR